MSAAWILVAATLGTIGLTAPVGAAGHPHQSRRAPLSTSWIRVDQQGYLPGEVKHARVMAPKPDPQARVYVVDGQGHIVRRIKPQLIGSWNKNFRAVYDVDFSGVRRPGSYALVGHGFNTNSPRFRIARADKIYGPLLRKGILFDQVQRDGADVIAGALDRQPAHLNDAAAFVYAAPRFEPDSDTVIGKDLRQLTGDEAGPVDVSGGWSDAGDYLKFTHSTAYNDVLLLLSQRMLGHRAPSTLGPEARHGLAWLTKMWHPESKTLYIQVGIGSSNRKGTFLGDHDGWRLPEEDDANADPLFRYVSHRPVFRAGPAGKPISPNLTGRVSAAFALAAQLDAKSHPQRAKRELHLATSVYRAAATKNPPRRLVTALPHAFYPEDTWHDDMELGAAEIALARLRLGGDARGYVRAAARWARGYLRQETGDTLNLYDTSALAHADLVRAMRATRVNGRLGVTKRTLLDDLRSQLRSGEKHAAADPFAAGHAYNDFDVNSHTFGLVATAAIFRRLTGSHRFDSFATRQRNWLLGGNPWGVSAMVGVGTRHPLCMQHQIANLSGSTSGSPPLVVGAVVNGPNNSANFEGGLGGYQDGMVHCSVSRYFRDRLVDLPDSRYVDDVRSWQTNEPALDMTGAAIIAAAASLSR